MADNGFEAVYRENYAGVRRFLSRLCKNDALSEELTQECFYQAFCSFHRYNGSCQLFTWLCAIAKNVYFKYLRKNKRESQLSEIFTDAGLFPGDEAEPENRLLRGERSRTVRAALDALPEKYRDVLILRVYAELSFAQIADALAISRDSAKVIFCRAKTKLKEALSNEL